MHRWSIIGLIIFILSAIMLTGCHTIDTAEVNENVENEIQWQVENMQIPTNELQEEYIFSKEPIPQDIREKMWGVTISGNSHVDFDDLNYLTITYYGYDDLSHQGHMVVDTELADEVISIFKELYDIKFPIEKMNLPYEYDGIDEMSMRDNNTSAFNDRPIEGSGGLSYHQLGRAIDINPLINPYIKFSTGEVLPATAVQYLDRDLEEKGMIKNGSPCVEIFERYGWTWGGNWNSLKDYQHFEKH